MILKEDSAIKDLPENVLRDLFGEFDPLTSGNIGCGSDQYLTYAVYWEIQRMNTVFGFMFDFLDNPTPGIREAVGKHGTLGAVYAKFAFDEEIESYFAVPGIMTVYDEFFRQIDGVEFN